MQAIVRARPQSASLQQAEVVRCSLRPSLSHSLPPSLTPSNTSLLPLTCGLPQKFLQWLNSQLMQVGQPQVDDLSKSLADASVIILALAVSGPTS